jgi:flagellar hook-basal body complex protein FliE
MIPSIGQGSSLARTAIEAALAAQAKIGQRVEAQVAGAFQPPAPPSIGSAAQAPAAGELLGKLSQGLGAVSESLAQVERLPLEMATGGIQDFSELAARLKQSELTFKFALEVRNKLIDAYRETMRMSV